MSTILELRAWLAAAPPGTLVPAALVTQALGETPAAASPAPLTWRERLWTCVPETRLGIAELREALGRSKGWVYEHTGPKASGVRLPHRKLGGELVFLAGEVRTWVREQEQVIARPTAALVVSRRARKPA